MHGTRSSQRDMRFGVFEIDVQARELRKKGSKVRLQRQPFELLLVLLDRPGEVVSREDLRRRLWPADVYVDFDRSLNKAMVKLRGALGDSSESPLYVETLPRIGYRFIGSITEIPPPPQVTADRIPPRIEVAKLQATDIPLEAAERPGAMVAVQPSNRRRILRLWLGGIAAVLFLTAGIVAGWAVRHHRQSSESIHSLAVLPLDNLSGDPNQEYFAAGMTDELTTMLAKNSKLRIISRTSVMQYEGTQRPLPEIARELGVDGIVEGSVARSADNVHISVQLIQAPSETHVWADSYDRNANDMVTLPPEIAQTIAKKLNSAVLRPVPTRSVSAEAHDAYLRGRYLWFADKNDEAGKYFKRATELQPDYALGWAGLSMYYGAGTVEGELDPRKSLALAEAAALKALALDDSLPEAHLARGTVYFLKDWNWERSQQEIARAIQLDPKFAEAYHFRAKILAALNRHEEAIAAQKEASELDPFARAFALPLSYMVARQYDAAIADARQRLESNPYDVSTHWILAFIYQCTRTDAEGAREWERMFSLENDEQSAASVRRAFQHGGFKAMMSWRLNVLKNNATTQFVSPVEMAYCHAELGHRQEALALLEQGYRQHDPALLWVQAYPAFDFLHADERYRSIIKRAGLPLTD